MVLDCSSAALAEKEKSMRRLIPTLLSTMLFLPLLTAAQSKLPKTPVRDVTEDYFGAKVVDPYRWLEKTSDPEVIAWMKAQNDYARSVLARIPGRAYHVARQRRQHDFRGPGMGRTLFLFQDGARFG
jgi:hypothetical protein